MAIKLIKDSKTNYNKSKALEIHKIFLNYEKYLSKNLKKMEDFFDLLEKISSTKEDIEDLEDLSSNNTKENKIDILKDKLKAMNEDKKMKKDKIKEIYDTILKYINDLNINLGELKFKKSDLKYIIYYINSKKINDDLDKNYKIYLINNSDLKKKLFKIVSNCDLSVFNISKFEEKDLIILQTFDTDDHDFDFPVIHFKINNQELIFKPRPSLLEISIMELFESINKVSKNKLPYYKIIKCNKYSIWEFVKGFTIDGSSNLVNLEDYLKENSKNKKLIENSLFLETICKYIGLTDLHYENIKLDNKLEFVYPIDMEAIEINNSFNGKTVPYHIYTGLYNEKKLLSLPFTIKKLILEFNNKLKKLPLRYLPISTVDLTNFQNNNITCLEIYNKIINYEPNIEPDVLVNQNNKKTLNEEVITKMLPKSKKTKFISNLNKIYKYNFIPKEKLISILNFIQKQKKIIYFIKMGNNLYISPVDKKKKHDIISNIPCKLIGKKNIPYPNFNMSIRTLNSRKTIKTQIFSKKSKVYKTKQYKTKIRTKYLY